MNKDNKTFCMLPWTHMHLWPAGTTYPCCMSDPNYPIGDTQKQSLQEIWNGDKMRKLRLNMLEGKRSLECRRCYELEENGMWTLRKSSNENFKHHYNKVLDTAEDGSAGDVNMAYMDIRFSNLCNLKCRSCGPQFSTSWFDDHVEAHGDPKHKKMLTVRDDMKNFMDELDPLLESVERVYWAGGEPLITEEHYKILDKWIAMGKQDIQMEYTTNFTKMQYRDKSVFDYWNSFKHVRVAGSIDANHERAEYLRKNMKWSEVVQNRKNMIEKCPHVYFEITPTVSAYNVLNLPDFHREWIEEGLLEPQNLRINILLDPSYMRLQILTDKQKDRVRERYQDHIAYLKQFENISSVIDGYNSILQFMEKDNDTDRFIFVFKTKQLDEIRQENFYSVFPELRGIE